jgi:hypothetical protein
MGKADVFAARGTSPGSGEASVMLTGYVFLSGEGLVKAGEAAPAPGEVSPEAKG